MPETLPRNAFLATDEQETPDLGDWLLNDLVARLQARGVRVTQGEGDIALIAHAPEKLVAEPVPALGMAPVVSSGPVSYTHLDVYKRQVRGPSSTRWNCSS